MGKGICVVVTGSSGTGKTSLVKRLLEEVTGSARLVTTTSRDPRPEEVDGLDYNFVSRDHFEHMIENGEFLEWEENYGNLYGSERAVLERMLEDYPVVFVALDIRGARTYKENVPGALTLALFVPPEQIPGRILGRAPIDSVELERRVEAVTKEQSEIGIFDYIVENLDGKLEDEAVPRAKNYITEALDKVGIGLPEMEQDKESDDAEA